MSNADRASRLPEHWPFSVSYSALTTYEACPRRWWLSAPGAWGGWPGGHRRHDPLAVAAYEGKNVWPLPAACGIAVHAAAEWAVRRTAEGRGGVTYEALWQRVRDTLNGVAARDLGAFRLRPKLGIVLERYLGRPLPADAIELTRTVAQSACRRLAAAEVLEHVRLCGRRDLLAVERLLTAAMEVDGEPVTVYGKCDMLYTLGETTRIDGVGLVAPGPEGIPVYADHKTGRGSVADHPRTRRQLAAGVWAAIAAGIVRPHDRVGVVGRVSDLSPNGPGDTVTLLGARDLHEAEEWLRVGARQLLRLPRDRHGVPLMAACPPRASRACAGCPMRIACELSCGEAYVSGGDATCSTDAPPSHATELRSREARTVSEPQPSNDGRKGVS